MTIRKHNIGFGGGCHWCTEAVFSSLVGIDFVHQGFIKSSPPNDHYSEAVWIQFDEKIIPLSVLIEIHLHTHASSSAHSMRHKYRSAIYVEDIGMSDRCSEILETLQKKLKKPLVTEVLDMIQFKQSEESYTDYYATNPNRPFCITYIEPKLAMLRREFKPYLT